MSRAQLTKTRRFINGAGGRGVDADQYNRDLFATNGYTLPLTIGTNSAKWLDIDASLIDIPASGVRWDTANSSPIVQRVVVLSTGEIALTTADWLPVHQQAKRCVVNNALEVQYYLDPANSLLKADGVTPSVLDGTDGSVMVQWPKFWYKIFGDGQYVYMIVSAVARTVKRPSDGVEIPLEVHPWFTEGGVERDYAYVGAFEGVLYDTSASSYIDGTGAIIYAAGDRIHSVYGYKPATYVSRSEFRAACADGSLHQIGYWGREALILLFFTWAKTLNSQVALPGYTEAAFTAGWTYDKVNRTGITAGLGNACGSISWQDAPAALRNAHAELVANPATIIANSFFGMENIFGHIWEWCDGINIQYIGNPLTDAEVYISNNPGSWADDTQSGYTDLGIDLPLTSQWQKSLHDGTLLPKTATGGSSSTYLCDYFYASAAEGWRALRSGGSLAHGAYAGVACRAASGAASSRASFGGGRSAG